MGETLDGTGAPLQPERAAMRRLATYGTFRPGHENHHVVAPLGGFWTEGWIEGETRTAREGRWQGYAGFVHLPGGPRLAAMMLESDALPGAWERLDAFEGPAFLRIAIPFFTRDGASRPASVYVLKDGC